MAKKSDGKKVLRFDSHRIRSVAFWFWEYQRRNPAYRHFSHVIENYRAYFDELGELEVIESEEVCKGFDADAFDMEDPNPKSHPYTLHLEERYGKKARLSFCRLSFLTEAVRRRFHRLYRNAYIGLNTGEALAAVLKGKSVAFESKDHIDINALLRSYYKWAMSIDDDAPNHYMADLDKTAGILLDHKQALKDPEQVMLELHAVKIFNATIDSIFSNKRISDETLEAVYKLCLSGDHIVSADMTRLIILWMWDKAHESDDNNPLSFDEVHEILKEAIPLKHRHNDKIATLLQKRQRLFEYYENLCTKINTMNPLCTKQNGKQLPSIKDVLSI
ncbi:MAG: hypothetical protein HY795_09855 [Desulfovibrio sp.]|nr:hypothetical protein [Desulfovibrio sp.]MBI4959607.1 hypothetical protein [Desulfovibrio sp.]